MGLKEYDLRLEAYRIREVHQQKELALQSWLNESIKETTGSTKHPKRKYRKFEQFFDTDAQIDQVRSNFEPSYEPQGQKAAERTTGEIMAKRIKEFRELKKAGKIIPLNERR